MEGKRSGLKHLSIRLSAKALPVPGLCEVPAREDACEQNRREEKHRGDSRRLDNCCIGTWQGHLTKGRALAP